MNKSRIQVALHDALSPKLISGEKRVIFMEEYQ